jgi:hypothetical protein
MNPRPAFLVTIDTEGDDLWSRPREIGTRNAAFLPRFQALCEENGLAPTWLVNHEMALCPVFRRFALAVLARGTGEIGLHLHAWNSPPLVALTDDDFRHQPYLVEYPPALMEEKIARLLALLRERFETPVVSHRAGRWALDSTYARLLVRHGIRIDTSVTPGLSWAGMPGAPQGRGGSDYRGFPRQPYRVDLGRIDRPGDSALLEVPVSLQRSRLHRLAPWAYHVPRLRRRAWAHRPMWQWLYPDGRNAVSMRELFDAELARGSPCLVFVLHSSELMPGGSPQSPDEASIEALYRDLQGLFGLAARHCEGMTLAEFDQRWSAGPALQSDREKAAGGRPSSPGPATTPEVPGAQLVSPRPSPARGENRQTHTSRP